MAGFIMEIQLRGFEEAARRSDGAEGALDRTNGRSEASPPPPCPTQVSVEDDSKLLCSVVFQGISSLLSRTGIHLTTLIRKKLGKVMENPLELLPGRVEKLDKGCWN